MSEIESEDDKRRRLAKGKQPLLSQEDQVSLVQVQGSSSGVFRDNRENEYTITQFLGDLKPAQVYRANYKIRDDSSPVTQRVTIKIFRIDKEGVRYAKAKSEFDLSLKNAEGNDEENANKVVKVTKFLQSQIQDDDTRLLFVVMPHMELGSIRYLMLENQLRRMPEKCVGMVLQETLRALSYLHGLGKFPTKVNAGFVYVTPENTATIKLGYQSSAYFHNPKFRPLPPKIYSSDSTIIFPVTQQNAYWVSDWCDPPEEQQNTAASDIWNVGIMALELAFGPVEVKYPTDQRMRERAEYYEVIRRIRETKNRLPTLQELFFGERLEENFGGTGKYQNKFTKKFGSFKRKWKLGKEGRLDDEDGKKKGYRMSKTFANMVRRCLVEPERRPTAEALLADTYFRNCDLDMRDFHDSVVLNLPKEPKKQEKKLFRRALRNIRP